MRFQDAQLAYRQTAVRDASPIDFVISLYDILAGDIQAAIVAIETRDIETRSAKLKHALLVLLSLEGCMDLEADGVVTKGLARLYSIMRGKILESQIRQDSEILRDQFRLILELRSAWAKVNSAPTSDGPYSPTQGEALASSWKA